MLNVTANHRKEKLEPNEIDTHYTDQADKHWKAKWCPMLGGHEEPGTLIMLAQRS